MNTQDDPRWKILLTRQEDDSFFYSVKTTGVYCRPSCAARLARPENVSFFSDQAEAEAAGFRACKRCKPDQTGLREQQARLVAQACHSLEQSPESPDLKDLASAAGLSLFHFHRLFKKLVGLTPRQYERANRAEKLRRALVGASSVTEAVFEAGYQSSSRFYENSQQVLGMKPGQYKDGGGQMIGYCIQPGRLTPWMLVAASEKGVCAIFLGEDPAALLTELRRRFPKSQLNEGDESFRGWVEAAVAAVEENQPAWELPLDVRGTVFQQKVWEALRQIPPGQTRTYSQLAEQIGHPGAVRAVGSACAANPIAVAIPCHRAVRSDGSLAGYYWGGPAIKRVLLDREG
ncbi:bifunctional DNA-binding transcriptional regulator/O6-methylguanine-DNA methyltransferase Ada [bacterium]|nr:bifunctional DNA-binding transcriptional regulator/O6-methylguanine-DNA methyltransferase Ada [bacterium]